MIQKLFRSITQEELTELRLTHHFPRIIPLVNKMKTATENVATWAMLIVVLIAGLVVHPKYRTIGLGAKLIRDTLPLIKTPNVGRVAMMAKYNPFAEKAGMKKIMEQKPSEEAKRLAEVLLK